MSCYQEGRCVAPAGASPTTQAQSEGDRSPWCQPPSPCLSLCSFSFK